MWNRITKSGGCADAEYPGVIPEAAAEPEDGARLSGYRRRALPHLITAGKVYLAQPPLYRIDIGKETFWALDDAHKDRILAEKAKGRATKYVDLD